MSLSTEPILRGFKRATYGRLVKYGFFVTSIAISNRDQIDKKINLL